MDSLPNDILNIIYEKYHGINFRASLIKIKKIKTHKTCKECTIEKPLEYFHNYKKNNITLYRVDCKICRNRKIKEAYRRGTIRTRHRLGL